MTNAKTTDDGFIDALRSLPPAATGLSIERLAFEAGRRAGRRTASAWRAVAGVVAIAGACAVGLRPKPATVTTERVVVIHDAAPPFESTPVVSSASYLRLRDAVIADGWTALPAPTGGGGPPGRIIDVRSFE